MQTSTKEERLSFALFQTLKNPESMIFWTTKVIKRANAEETIDKIHTIFRI
jgi:hypothetical protein